MADFGSLTSPAALRMDRLLAELWMRRGTDLLVTVGAPPLMRVDGQMQTVAGEQSLTPEDTRALVSCILSAKELEDFQKRRDFDFVFSWMDRARVRGNAFMQRGSTGLSLRMIPATVPTMEDLGLPAVVSKLVDQPSGLILVTGPTGSGKSTTLAAMVDHVNRTRRCHILTIEDPIEYVHQHGCGAVTQREVGQDTESFARALRSALREDPDVLMVGEMRDLESIDAVLTMAETGHLVFATLHTNDTTQTVDRLVGVFPGERQEQVRLQLSACLSGVIYQRLVPRVGGGQMAAFEVLLGTHAVRNLIREGHTRQLRNAITMGKADGMQTLEMNLFWLVSEGYVSREDAVTRSLHPNEIADTAGIAARTAGRA
jgi:twitching motility protein PilT